MGRAIYVVRALPLHEGRRVFGGPVVGVRADVQLVVVVEPDVERVEVAVEAAARELDDLVEPLLPSPLFDGGRRTLPRS